MLIQRHNENILNRYMHPTYTGRGLGSVFGRLIAGIGSKVVRTGLRSAIAVGSKVARKGLSSVVKNVGAKGAKSIIKTVARKGLRAGKQLVKNQIKTAPQKLLNYAIKEADKKNVSHLVRKTIAQGSRNLLNNIASNTAAKPILGELVKEVQKVFSPTAAARSAPLPLRRGRAPRASAIIPRPPVNKRKRKLAPNLGQQQRQPKRRRRKSRKNYSASNINSLIARS